MTEPKEVINLKDDVFIHYLYSDPDDEDKRFFFKVVIEDLLHLSCEGMQIISPQIIPDRDHQKFMTVDIRVKLKDGTTRSIEMQQAAFSMSHYKRFATYNAKMLAEQIDRGQEYQEVKPVIQVIFINDIDSDNNEDSTFLNNFTVDQYNSLFSAMLDHKTLDELKSLLK